MSSGRTTIRPGIELHKQAKSGVTVGNGARSCSFRYIQLSAINEYHVAFSAPPHGCRIKGCFHSESGKYPTLFSVWRSETQGIALRYYSMQINAMFKALPSALEQPEEFVTSPYVSSNAKVFHETAMRAVDYYLNPGARKVESAVCAITPVFVVSPQADAESLLTQICESMASASALAEVAAGVEGAPRKIIIALQQVIMLAEMAGHRMLDSFKHGAAANSATCASSGVADSSVAV